MNFPDPKIVLKGQTIVKIYILPPSILLHMHTSFLNLRDSNAFQLAGCNKLLGDKEEILNCINKRKAQNSINIIIRLLKRSITSTEEEHFLDRLDWQPGYYQFMLTSESYLRYNRRLLWHYYRRDPAYTCTPLKEHLESLHQAYPSDLPEIQNLRDAIAAKDNPNLLDVQEFIYSMDLSELGHHGI